MVSWLLLNSWASYTIKMHSSFYGRTLPHESSFCSVSCYPGGASLGWQCRSCHLQTNESSRFAKGSLGLHLRESKDSPEGIAQAFGHELVSCFCMCSHCSFTLQVQGSNLRFCSVGSENKSRGRKGHSQWNCLVGHKSSYTCDYILRAS